MPKNLPPIECITPEAGSPEARAIEETQSRPEPTGAIATVPAMIAEPLHTAPLHAQPITAELDPRDATSPQREPVRSVVESSGRLEGVSTEEIYRELLLRMGDDPARDGLVRTPERVDRAMKFLTRGYAQTVESVLHNALFDVDYDEMVIVRDVEFYSLCEHHLLPFFGKAHIAYIPDGKVVGLSKLPRLVDVYARRLQVQERLTRQIAEAIVEAVHPQGVAVILEAQHLCMMMRGVEKQQSLTTTSAMLGVFRSQVQTRNEFLSLLRRPGVTF